MVSTELKGRRYLQKGTGGEREVRDPESMLGINYFAALNLSG